MCLGAINMLRRKGGKYHQKLGKIFFWGMNLAGFSSFVLAILHPNLFLFTIGVFTLYLNFTGNMYLKVFKNKRAPSTKEKVATLLMALAGLVFLILGVEFFRRGSAFGVVYMLFTAISLFFVVKDLINYKSISYKHKMMLLEHIQRMSATFISALTAFLVVNAHHFSVTVPIWFWWILPTILVTPFIIYWSAQYGRRLSTSKD